MDTQADLVRSVVGIVGAVLQKPDIDPALSFAALGGDSLEAVHVISLIEEAHGVSIPLEVIIDGPELVSVAQAIARALSRT